MYWAQAEPLAKRTKFAERTTDKPDNRVSATGFIRTTMPRLPQLPQLPRFGRVLGVLGVLVLGVLGIQLFTRIKTRLCGPPLEFCVVTRRSRSGKSAVSRSTSSGLKPWFLPRLRSVSLPPGLPEIGR